MTAASLRFLSFRPQGEIFYRFLTPFGMTEKEIRMTEKEKKRNL